MGFLGSALKALVSPVGRVGIGGFAGMAYGALSSDTNIEDIRLRNALGWGAAGALGGFATTGPGLWLLGRAGKNIGHSVGATSTIKNPAFKKWNSKLIDYYANTAYGAATSEIGSAPARKIEQNMLWGTAKGLAGAGWGLGKTAGKFVWNHPSITAGGLAAVGLGYEYNKVDRRQSLENTLANSNQMPYPDIMYQSTSSMRSLQNSASGLAFGLHNSRHG